MFVGAAKDAVGNWSYASRRWFTDLTLPSAALTAPTQPLSLASPTVVSWAGSDAGGSGLSSFDVRISKAAPGAAHGYRSEEPGTACTDATGRYTV